MPQPATISAVAVFCGSSPGFDAAYAQAAAALGRLLAERRIALVFGGGHVGLMGVVADAALSAGGQAHGVITRALQGREPPHHALTSLRVVESMHERKAAMADAADGFIMLPGGFGTLDEFFEALTWTQLGIHAKPCGAVDVGGFFGPLRAMMEQAVRAGFVRQQHADMVLIESDPAVLLDRMQAWTRPEVPKWLGPAQR